MYNIGDFFGKIRNIHSKEILIRSVICEAVKSHTGAEVDMKNIKLDTGGVVLKGISQTLRSAIYIKKDAILREINEKQSLRKVGDIR